MTGPLSRRLVERGERAEEPLWQCLEKRPPPTRVRQSQGGDHEPRPEDQPAYHVTY